ncbi:MAG: hypothetical protein LBL87_02665 [Ruminococcus sp.]|jgi:hypothetical protein|nr:hypothetical protein [Ruminococcus sp.]
MEQSTILPIELGKEMQDVISRRLGIPFNDVVNLTPDEADNLVREITGKAPIYGKKRDNRRIGRGNPLLARRKIRTLEDLENNKDALKWLRKF